MKKYKAEEKLAEIERHRSVHYSADITQLMADQIIWQNNAILDLKETVRSLKEIIQNVEDQYWCSRND